MSPARFHITRLIARGIERPNAELHFKLGLNVVYGASDTGKSYILDCLTYMLGGGTQPKNIPERDGYSSLFLEIQSTTNAIVTFKRSLDGGGATLFRKPFHEISQSEDDGEALTSIKDFLVSLMSAEKVKLLKNKDGETRKLTFRDVRELSFIGETRILDQRSPILSGQFINETVEKSVFRHLMTGLDDSDFVASLSSEKTRDKINHQLLVYEKLIEGVRKQVADLLQQPMNVDGDVTSDDLSMQIQSITDNVSIVGQEVDAALLKRDHIYGRKREVEQRVAEISALLTRFKILKKQYQNDLERLEFISEGDHFFAQLKPVECPYCGGSMKNHKGTALCIEKGKEISLNSACQAELSKLQSLKTDLESTVVRLEKEKKELIKSLEPLDEGLIGIQKTIEDILKPRIKSGKYTLQELLKQKDFLGRKESLEAQLFEHESERDKLKKLSASAPKKKDDSSSIGKSYLELFCQKVSSLLDSWGFQYEGTVYLDTTTMDLVIGGKARGDFGKGLRAVSYSAFIVGLLSYCVEKQHTHSGIIVLDSPLTAHRGKQKNSEAEMTTEEISKEIEEKFFTNLASFKNEQIIILENVSPPDSIKDKANLECFSGSKEVGRYGFYPVLKQEKNP